MHSEHPRPGDEAPAQLTVSVLSLVWGRLLPLGLCPLSYKLEVEEEVGKMDRCVFKPFHVSRRPSGSFSVLWLFVPRLFSFTPKWPSLTRSFCPVSGRK